MARHRSSALALLATSLGFGVVQLDVGIVNVAVQPIREDLGGSVSAGQWVVNAYTVVFAALILTLGALGDRLGARRVFVAGFAVFTAASALCGLAPSLGLLVAARALQGVGAAALVPSSLSVLNHAYGDPAARARAVGLWAAGASVGFSGGPLAGGLLTGALSWRWIYWVNLPLGLLGIALTLRHAEETSRSTDRGFDPPGATLGVVTLAALAAAAIQGGRSGFSAPPVLAGFGVAVVAGAAFIVVEARRRRPMLPLALFAGRTFSATTAVALLLNVAVYGLIFVLGIWFQTDRGYSPVRTGLAFAPMTGVVLVANLTAGRLTARLGTRRVLVTGGAVLAVSCAGLVLAADGGFPELVSPLLGIGVSTGIIVPAMTAAMLGSVDKSRSGIASGTLNTARQTGSVVGVAVFGSLAASDATAGLRASAAIGAGLAVVLSVVSTLTRDPDAPAAGVRGLR